MRGGLSLLVVAVAFAAGSYLGHQLWGGAGILFWLGICLSYLLAARSSTWWYGFKIFSFAVASATLLLGGGSILANTVGVWAVVPWFVACMVFVTWLRKRMIKVVRW